MHKTKLDRKYERLFGTLPSPPKPVKRRGCYWVMELSGNVCYYSSTTYHILDEIHDWLNSRTDDWYVVRTEHEYNWAVEPTLTLFLPSLELATEFRLIWCDHNS